jgi:hypothetical protein
MEFDGDYVVIEEHQKRMMEIVVAPLIMVLQPQAILQRIN